MFIINISTANRNTAFRMKITRKQLRRLIIETADAASHEDVKKLMKMYYEAMDLFQTDDEAGEALFNQTFELANMLELTRHPGWKVWYLYSSDSGLVRMEGLNYDQAINPKYHMLALSKVAWKNIEDQYNQYNQYVSHNPPTEADFEEARKEMIELGHDKKKIIVTEIDDEHGYVEIQHDHLELY